MFSIKRLVAFEQDWSIGILIALVLTVLLLFAIYSATNKKNQKFSLLSFIIAIPVLVLLSYQMSLLVGAITILNDSYDITSIVSLFSVDFAGMIDSEIESSLGWYIFRRSLWTILFLSIGGAGIVLTMDKKRSRSHNVPSGIQTGRRYTSNVRRR